MSHSVRAAVMPICWTVFPVTEHIIQARSSSKFHHCLHEKHAVATALAKQTVQHNVNTAIQARKVMILPKRLRQIILAACACANTHMQCTYPDSFYDSCFMLCTRVPLAACPVDDTCLLNHPGFLLLILVALVLLRGIQHKRFL